MRENLFTLSRQYLEGKNKGLKQLRNVEDAYVAQDDIEIGIGKKIPLWLFGFLY